MEGSPHFGGSLPPIMEVDRRGLEVSFPCGEGLCHFHACWKEGRSPSTRSGFKHLVGQLEVSFLVSWRCLEGNPVLCALGILIFTHLSFPAKKSRKFSHDLSKWSVFLLSLDIVAKSPSFERAADTLAPWGQS